MVTNEVQKLAERISVTTKQKTVKNKNTNQNDQLEVSVKNSGNDERLEGKKPANHV